MTCPDIIAYHELPDGVIEFTVYAGSSGCVKDEWNRPPSDDLPPYGVIVTPGSPEDGIVAHTVEEIASYVEGWFLAMAAMLPPSYWPRDFWGTP